MKILSDQIKQYKTHLINEEKTKAKPLYTEVKRIGGNIHQIAKLAYFGKIEAVNLEGVQAELSKIYDELQKIVKRCS